MYSKVHLDSNTSLCGDTEFDRYDCFPSVDLFYICHILYKADSIEFILDLIFRFSLYLSPPPPPTKPRLRARPYNDDIS